MPFGQVPNWGVDIMTVGKAGVEGFTREWYRFFASLGTPGLDPQPQVPSGSPFDYTAGGPGTVFVSGGTVSAIAVIRGGTTVPTGVVAGAIPVSTNDVVRITYTVAPTVNFLGD